MQYERVITMYKSYYGVSRVRVEVIRHKKKTLLGGHEMIHEQKGNKIFHNDLKAYPPNLLIQCYGFFGPTLMGIEM